MKKIILLVAVMAINLSCSNDENDYLYPTIQNLGSTKWQFNTVTKEDGTVVNYVNKCATQKDYLAFIGLYSGYMLQEYFGIPSCVICYGCGNDILNVPIDENGNLQVAADANAFYYKGRITSLSKTKDKMKIVYNPPKIVDKLSSYGKIKSIELVKFVEE